MRSWSLSHDVRNAAKPGANAWPPTRQKQRAEESLRGWQERDDLPPRPEAPPATAPTPGMAAPLAPQIFQAYRAPGGPALAIRNERTVKNENHTAVSSREAAGREIEGAGSALHRTEAILTQLKVVGAEAPNVGPALSEAKHAYEQGLSSFRSNAYMSAGEFAAASSALSRAVAIVLLRALRSRAADDLHASPNQNHRPNPGDRRPSRQDFSSVASRISRVLWLFEYGTLPSEVIEQARKIASWSEQLYRQAQRSFRNGAWEDALELVQAAEAAAYSAEHVCKMCYLKEG